ncbi:hypothetical protein [Acanthopleuribacter pedis]|uniref:Uncharacterized protein n=1 Tax=Acanthopleuribacter pedis TaxID=442870 RepID=A0A8J7U1S0_9BACT|nr:hypothetical protein [Acanthopleuribacter pedis]MBO1317822.1 hypothetical protein [Acanthopleuribacter pedis]
MEVDLRGQTVTQAVVLARRAIAECEADQLVLKTESEVVKLNLYNALTKMGHRCRLERQGPFFTLTVQIGGGARKPRAQAEPDDGSVVRKEITAFPARNLDAEEVKSARRRRRSERREEAAERAHSARSEQARAPQAPREQAPAEQPSAGAPQAGAGAPQAGAGAPQPSVAQPGGLEVEASMMCWLILQQEQLGQRDSKLGYDLLAEFLESLEPSRFAGMFLIHRAARLCDPSFQQGRFLKILRARRIHLWVCAKSLNYYEIEDPPAPIQRAQIIDIQRLASLYRLVWI